MAYIPGPPVQIQIKQVDKNKETETGVVRAVQGLFGIDYDRDKSEDEKFSQNIRYVKPLSEYPHAWYAIERPKIHWSWSIVFGLIGLLAFSLYIVM